MKTHIFYLLALSFLFSSCENSSGPPANSADLAISLRTDSPQYKYNAQGTTITILLQNDSPDSIYCPFVRGRAVFAVEILADTLWFLVENIGFTDISRDSLYYHVIRTNTTYRDTFTLVAPGTYRLSTGITVASESPIDKKLSSTFQIIQ